VWRFTACDTRRQFRACRKSCSALHPGLGGTARLPALIPPLDAMQMMAGPAKKYL